LHIIIFTNAKLINQSGFKKHIYLHNNTEYFNYITIILYFAVQCFRDIDLYNRFVEIKIKLILQEHFENII